ncbi:MAG: L-aspartate oxidase [Candidatus Izemoplasmatales bacterium]|jgi:L-aspartate oxidase|nr:L-aspartate oxidase [Candidatus Izemoplasmatales bacterium]MDD3864829.1 L-aspartate oxidase [Candidatus Izemoplasmatales bacterium]
MDIKTDVLIIGSGLAGLFTALNISSKTQIVLLAKQTLINSNSMLAQGGIAAELNDDVQLHASHVEDTMKAGSYLNDLHAVQVLVDNADEAIKKLMAFGVEFDRGADDEILLTKEGGHKYRRIIHSGGDATGFRTTKSLVDILYQHPNITVLEHTMAIDLLQDNQGACLGATVLSGSNEYYAIYAKKTVLATGGIGSVYNATTNDLSATGDGIGLANRIGAEIKNMEFVQFHPTAFFVDEGKSRQRFLISEAVRGEGATLLNVQKERFMGKYAPELMELAPRDIVSQAIFREMYDTWTDHVFLDTTHMDPKFLEKRFPTIFQKCKEHGMIMGIDLIPVAPCEHFICGGISTDLNGETTVKNLYAVGECANSGVHGANRLASNSLLECAVFGMAIAEEVDKTLPNVFISIIDYQKKLPSYNYNYKPIRRKIGNYMDEHVSIVRNTDGLKLTADVLDTIFNDLIKYPNLTKTYYETLNLATTAKIITAQALARKDSIGCHLRIK